MARGQASKREVADKILQTFSGSFEYNNGKEIRIPLQENGEIVQIKVTLTAAKTNVEAGEDVAVPGAKVAVKTQETSPSSSTVAESLKPTEEEKQRVSSLLAQLGM